MLPIVLYCQIACYSVNRYGQLYLERINRFICRIVANDFVSPYNDLLERVEIPSVVQQVYGRRLLLAYRYSRGTRHQPAVTLASTRQGRFPSRLHAYALTVVNPTPVSVSQSAIESTVAIWNLLPGNVADLSFVKLRRMLSNNSFDPVVEPYIGAWHAIRVM
jgi:hypothetical protein